MPRYMNTGDVPLALAVFLANDNYDYNDDPNTISVTTLLKPLRQIILPLRIPATLATVSLPDMMSNRLGAAVHDAIERSWKDKYALAMAALGYPERVIQRIRINPSAAELQANPDLIPIYLEQRAHKKVGKWTVSGKYDFIGEGRVQDFKTASVWSYMNQVNAEKQSWQGSLYRWLDPEKITQDEMDIHHILMDWRESQVKADPNYPPRRFIRQTFPLFSLRETQSFVERKLALIDQYLDAPEEEIPACEDEDLWRSKNVFKYFASGDINAAKSTKNFDSAQEARNHLAAKGKGAIKEVRGTVKACRYCAAFAACTQKDALVATGELVL